MSKRRDRIMQATSKGWGKHVARTQGKWKRPKGKKPSIDEALARIRARFI